MAVSDWIGAIYVHLDTLLNEPIPGPMAQWLNHLLVGWQILCSHLGTGSNGERVFKGLMGRCKANTLFSFSLTSNRVMLDLNKLNVILIRLIVKYCHWYSLGRLQIEVLMECFCACVLLSYYCITDCNKMFYLFILLQKSTYNLTFIIIL